MARPRPIPSTPFGAWLDAWFREHPDWTFESFAHEVGVTKSAISLWVSGATRRVPLEKLREVARVTGEPVENLEQLVYGRRPPQSAARLDPAIVAAIDASVERAVNRLGDRLELVLRELLARDSG